MHKLAQLSAVILAAFLGAAGCDPPCVALAKEVCRCEATEREQRACIERVEDDASAREATDEESARCEELLDTCSCERLDAGDLAACGLTNP